MTAAAPCCRSTHRRFATRIRRCRHPRRAPPTNPPICHIFCPLHPSPCRSSGGKFSSTTPLLLCHCCCSLRSQATEGEMAWTGCSLVRMPMILVLLSLCRCTEALLVGPHLCACVCLHMTYRRRWTVKANSKCLLYLCVFEFVKNIITKYRSEKYETCFFSFLLLRSTQ